MLCHFGRILLATTKLLRLTQSHVRGHRYSPLNGRSIKNLQTCFITPLQSINSTIYCYFFVQGSYLVPFFFLIHFLSSCFLITCLIPRKIRRRSSSQMHLYYQLELLPLISSWSAALISWPEKNRKHQQTLFNLFSGGQREPDYTFCFP